MTPTPPDTPPEAAALEVLVASALRPFTHRHKDAARAALRIVNNRAARQHAEPQGSRASPPGPDAELREALEKRLRTWVLSSEHLKGVVDAVMETLAALRTSEEEAGRVED